ncbi:MAG: hypothetical protein M1499_08715 [Firmicutes bacterium]|nr:hypothetical protein [Bacillota bacterium]
MSIVIPDHNCFVVAQPAEFTNALEEFSRNDRPVITQNGETPTDLMHWTTKWRDVPGSIWLFTIRTVALQSLTVSDVSALSKSAIQRVRRRIVPIDGNQHLVILGPWQIAFSTGSPIYRWGGDQTEVIETWDVLRQALRTKSLLSTPVVYAPPRQGSEG